MDRFSLTDKGPNANYAMNVTAFGIHVFINILQEMSMLLYYVTHHFYRGNHSVQVWRNHNSH